VSFNHNRDLLAVPVDRSEFAGRQLRKKRKHVYSRIEDSVKFDFDGRSLRLQIPITSVRICRK